MNLASDYWLHVAPALVALLALGGALWALTRAPKSPTPISSFSLDRTISDIKAELTKLESEAGPSLGLRLSEVKIALQLSQEDAETTSAGLSVPVFSAAEIKGSAGWTAELGSKVTIVLVPPVDRSVLSSHHGSALKFADLLISVRESLRKAMQNEPQLDAKSIEVELSFVLVAETSAGAEVKVRLLSLGVGRSQKTTAGNTVTLTYQNPAYGEKGSPRVTPP